MCIVFSQWISITTVYSSVMFSVGVWHFKFFFSFCRWILWVKIKVQSECRHVEKRASGFYGKIPFAIIYWCKLHVYYFSVRTELQLGSINTTLTSHSFLCTSCTFMFNTLQPLYRCKSRCVFVRNRLKCHRLEIELYWAVPASKGSENKLTFGFCTDKLC